MSLSSPRSLTAFHTASSHILLLFPLVRSFVRSLCRWRGVPLSDCQSCSEKLSNYSLNFPAENLLIHNGRRESERERRRGRARQRRRVKVRMAGWRAQTLVTLRKPNVFFPRFLTTLFFFFFLSLRKTLSVHLSLYNPSLATCLRV